MPTRPLGWALYLLILCLVNVAAAQAAELESRLDRTRVSEGETVTLMLRHDGSLGGAPDLGPLRQDFEVLNQGQSTRMHMINGRTESWHEWQLLLAPRRTGQLSIPALQLGGAMSQPLTLEVVPASQAAPGAAPGPVMLEVEVSNEQPYVQGKVIYTVRLLTRVQLRQPQLADPASDNVLVERLGEDRRYETYRNGQSYRVVERRYAIFPQRSGEMRISGPMLTAQVREPRQQQRPQRDRLLNGRDPFSDFDRFFGSDPFADIDSLFGRMRTVRIRAQEVSLEVQPQPPGTPTPWLPAESVALNETWSPDPPRFRVGEPVTRTIAITAQGVSATQLPDLAPAASGGISLYPDKPRLQTRVDGDTLVAQKTTATALVPSQPGKYTLPAVELHWWNTQHNRPEVARLPARMIEVAAGAAATPAPSGNPVSPAPAPQVDPAPGNIPPADRQLPAAGGTAQQGLEFNNPWAWLAAAFALAWLITVVLWWRTRRNRQPTPAVSGPGPAASITRPDPAAALRELQQACEQNDARGARQALLGWAAAHWPAQPPQTLQQLALRLPQAAGDALHDLDRHLYAAGGSPWHGSAAWQALQAALTAVASEQGKSQRSGALPPLYPGQG